MVIFGPITVVILVLVVYFFSKQRTDNIPVFINGLIPSLPNATTKQESGSTVYVFYSDKSKDEEEREIIRTYSDENGTVQTTISSKNIGRPVTVRIRHAGFKFEDYQLTVPKHGIIHTAKMVRDGVYDRPARGAQISDLLKHFDEASAVAENIRADAIRFAQSLGRRFARIPVLFWIVAYISLIFAFAADYVANSTSFNLPFDSFAHAFYFSTVTITTLGYGEIHPTDDLFRLMCAFEAIGGVVTIGLFLNSLFYERR